MTALAVGADELGVVMTASEDFTSVTDPFRAELLAHSYPGLFGSFRLPPVYQAAAVGAVLTGADREGRRGAC